MKRLTSALSFVPAAAHEATHYLFSLPLSEQSELRVSPLDGEAYVRVHQWSDDVPNWAIRLAFVAPTVVGFGVGLLVAIWWVLSGGNVPETVGGWAKMSLALIVWSVYVVPSRADIQGAIRR